MNNRMEIKKIPVDMLLEVLTEIYNSGVDYVNMVVEKGPHQDNVWIIDSQQVEEKIEEKNVNFDELI
jgi:transcription initiation factor IIE alpha subunit